MFGNRVFAWLVACATLAALAATACGGSSESVRLVWRPAEGSDIQFDPAAPKDGPLFQTMVFVSNNTDAILHDARLRFQMDNARNAPVGFRVGTVAPISSRFEGGDQLWSVGDIAPNTRVAVQLGLWFDLDYKTSQEHPVELILALVSPDLGDTIESNALRVRLGP